MCYVVVEYCTVFRNRTAKIQRGDYCSICFPFMGKIVILTCIQAVIRFWIKDLMKNYRTPKRLECYLAVTIILDLVAFKASKNLSNNPMGVTRY